MISVRPFLRSQLDRSVKERGGYIAIIDGLKQTETANVALVQRIVIRVIAGHDSTEDLPFFRARNNAASPCL
jgi:hypothetical protein